MYIYIYIYPCTHAYTHQQTAAKMESFAQVNENLDVQLATMEKSLNITCASTMPEQQVDDLLMQVADENGLEIQSQLSRIGVGSGVTVSANSRERKEKEKEKESEESELERRLKELQSI